MSKHIVEKACPLDLNPAEVLKTNYTFIRFLFLIIWLLQEVREGN